MLPRILARLQRGTKCSVCIPLRERRNLIPRITWWEYQSCDVVFPLSNEPRCALHGKEFQLEHKGHLHLTTTAYTSTEHTTALQHSNTTRNSHTSWVCSCSCFFPKAWRGLADAILSCPPLLPRLTPPHDHTSTLRFLLRQRPHLDDTTMVYSALMCSAALRPPAPKKKAQKMALADFFADAGECTAVMDHTMTRRRVSNTS